jgi:CDGSH-type Zn-finger protein
MAATRITVNTDGSIKVEGDFAILDPEGREFGLGGRTAISLCRCGQSQNKPFCDGSHRRIGFQDRVEARDLPAPVPKPAV